MSEMMFHCSAILTISVREAGVAAHRAVPFEDDRLLDRHASGKRNVKFLNPFNTNFSTMWSHMLYTAFKDDVSAILWRIQRGVVGLQPTP